SHFRRLRELDPTSRGALFHLEAHARTEGPSRELAELEQAVARAFAGDARAEAAFYTRAGETLRAIGDREAAVSSFRAAVTALPDHLPALTGWREAAASGGQWLDVADATERAAEATQLEDGRAALDHLAGVVLMDRVSDGERAIAALRRVLDVDPGHTDSFLRLKLLYEETGQDVELVELYHQRLSVEEEPSMRVALHQGLAGLYRNFFDDREGARRHLKSALELESDNLRAVADLSDIAWELGDWAEAAEALIARAKLETRPEVLRHIFYRLGTIYADRLPDPRYAMMSFQKVLTYHPGDTAALAQVADLAARSGDHRLALGACEQLIKLTPSDADKVVHLHRVARVYLDGLHDRQKAERAYRIALDMDPTSETALMALVDFYREVGDSISARVHLDRVAGAMRQRVAADPAQAQPYQVLARALDAREQAVAGSRATAQCAAEIAVLLGSSSPRDAELAAASSRSRPPLSGLIAPEVDDLLFPAPVSSSLRALFRMLGERIAKQLGLDVRRHGVGRAERLRDTGDPLASSILEMARDLDMPELDIYVSQRQPTVLAVEPTNPPSLVIGAQLASLDRPAELRFLVGGALKLAQSSLAVPARMSVDELGALLAGMLRQFSPEFTPAGLDPAQIAAEQQKLRRLIPSHMVQELAPFGLDVAASADFDHAAVWAGIIEGGNRAGLLAAGSAGAALDAVLRLGGYRDIHQGVRDPFVAGLLRFAVSEDHAALRAQLGS
ncbi:MAG TPA: hypothetical protein VNO33_20800, partial [Kofleriaceae bacterium]|nr:hypothetical protein [Kofleriaceae bacterium]